MNQQNRDELISQSSDLIRLGYAKKASWEIAEEILGKAIPAIREDTLREVSNQLQAMFSEAVNKDGFNQYRLVDMMIALIATLTDGKLPQEIKDE